MSKLDTIDHFVVLMLENRSFDNLLGQLGQFYAPASGFNGLSGKEFNLDAQGIAQYVWNNPQAPRAGWIPSPDPGELFDDIHVQLFGTPQAGTGTPDMSGFARNYSQPKIGGQAHDIMHFFSPAELPALSTLARSFAVSDAWFASAPCQTWPNRFFVHCGTANGYENNSPPHFPYLMPTIFNELQGVAPAGWKVYFHDFPQALTLSRLWDHLDHFRLIDEFLDDAAHGQLPSYAFIEPRYFADLDWPNDMHPPHNVAYGDRLVAQVYEALRSSPAWARTMLIVIFDEHGGCYDHVPPPAAVMPAPPAPGQLFKFDRYGVRVPALVASPYIPAGTVFRAPGGTPFDHTSVISTLRKRFGLTRPLSARDALAPDLESLLTLATPDNPGPAQLPSLPVPPEDDPAALAAASQAPLNDFQRALHEAAAHLVPLLHGVPVAQHIQALSQKQTPVVPPAGSVGEAVPFFSRLLKQLLP